MTQNYQQTLDITIGEDERVWFKVSGTHTIYLTGNYVEPIERSDDYDSEEDDYDEDDYDLEPDSDELDSDEEDELDELDELEDPRVTELDEDDEAVAPKLIESLTKKANEELAAKLLTKGKGKRAAPDNSDDEDAAVGAQTIDEMMSEAVEGKKELSKKEKKKLKKNDGAAGAAPAAAKAAEKEEKKVSFAKQLEQGPTGAKADKKEAAAASPSVKTVQGVTIEDKKVGSGQAAKSGDRVSMRYIGKLQKDGKVFDSNKKGKPFAFKLGSGEVIKGWDIGVAGMSAGGERRITVPAHLAYGSKSLPGIPAKSTLVFDVKCLDINKGK